MSEATNPNSAPAPTVAESPPPAPQPPVRGSEPHEVGDTTVRWTTAIPEDSLPPSTVTWWLTERDQIVFSVLAAVVLVLLIVRWMQLSGWGSREIEIERLTPLAPPAALDLNDATWVELAQLHGVGEALAVRIVEDRRHTGPFRSLDDLDRVKGIGPKMIEQLRPHLTVTPTSDEH